MTSSLLQVDVVPAPPVLVSEPAQVLVGLLVGWMVQDGAEKKPVISRLGGGFNDFLFSSIYCMGVSKNSGFSPQIIHFNRDFQYKPSILGYHYSWKHPYVPGELI